jgi:hypothetical protein
MGKSAGISLKCAMTFGKPKKQCSPDFPLPCNKMEKLSVESFPAEKQSIPSAKSHLLW